VISQGCACDLWNVSRVGEVPWLLVKSTEGIFSGIPGNAQKQASAEAAGVRRKRNGETPYPYFYCITFIPVCQKESCILSLFTWREKGIERFFQDVENTKSFLMRLEKQMVPGTPGVPCGENHR
jgi:hypothetical protein